MNKHAKYIFFSARRYFSALIIIIGIITLSSMFAVSFNDSNELPSLDALTPHAPILIDSDNDFNVFPGIGTLEDPYLIEGYHITGTSSITCIAIRWTTKAFIIKNCYLEGSMNAISLNEIGDNNAIISNNTILSGSISIIYSNNYTITSNTISDGFGSALHIQHSDGNTISNNILTNHNYCFTLYNCHYNIITNNTISYNTEALKLSSSSFNIVEDNKCLDNSIGIRLNLANNNTLRNNECEGSLNGIELLDSDYNNISYNYCNNSYDGGIILSISHHNTISNNFCLDNAVTGIKLSSSNYNNVEDNYCSYNYKGIELDTSSNNNILENEIDDNSYGLYLKDSENNILHKNFILKNTHQAVEMMSGADNNLIYENIFLANSIATPSQCYDGGLNNMWYNQLLSLGNYWSDWDGSEYYSIPGSAQPKDLYPSEYPLIPPVISLVNSVPLNIYDLDKVNISASVTDNMGVDSVTLHYRIDGGDWVETMMVLSTNSIYVVSIGPFNAHEEIEYYISAEDISAFANTRINDNSGNYYSFSVKDSGQTTGTIAPLFIPVFSILVLTFGLIVKRRRKTRFKSN